MGWFWRDLKWEGKGSSNKDTLHMYKFEFKICLLHTLVLRPF